MVNSLVLMRLVRGPRFALDPAMVIDGVPAIDPAIEPIYFGHSQGGISGGVYLALSTEVRRAMLGVPGAPYGLLLPRSIDFDPFLLLVFLRYNSAVDRISLMHVLQQLWDRAEPAGFLNLLASQPEKTALFQYGLGDSQVSWLGTYAQARSIGAAAFSSRKILDGYL